MLLSGAAIDEDRNSHFV